MLEKYISNARRLLKELNNVEKTEIKLKLLGEKIANLFDIPVVPCWSYDYKGYFPSGDYYVIFWQQFGQPLPARPDHLETDKTGKLYLVLRDGTKIEHNQSKNTEMAWDAVQADNPMWLTYEISKHFAPDSHRFNFLKGDYYATTE